MFFVSEEFLRKYEEDEGQVEQTIDEAVPLGEGLFDNTGGKRGYNVARRNKSDGPARPEETTEDESG